LLVGVGDYAHADRIQRLPFASRDARALTRLLMNPDIGRFAKDQVALLIDVEARRDTIVQRLSKWLPERSRGADLAIIYFAGHGMVQKVGRKEEGYLIAYDADPDEIVTKGVAMSDIAHWIDGIEAASVVVILDCCHSGKVLIREGATLRSMARDVGVRPAVLQVMAGKGRMLIASCDEGQKSIEDPDLKHGLFTYHLLRGIEGAADRDRDGRVGIKELFDHVSAAVIRDAKNKFNLDQQPWASATWTNDTHISWAKPRAKSAAAAPSLERLWRELGPDAAMANLERMLGKGEEPWIRGVLKFLRTKRDPAAIPLLFHCLSHRSKIVSRKARALALSFGWEALSAKAVDQARHAGDENGPQRVGFLLGGLKAIEAGPEVVGLLERLVIELTGSLRNSAILLLERKRLGLQLDEITDLFRRKASPYRIEKVLGQGVFTASYLGTHELTGLSVVVRVLRPEFVGQPHLVAQFLDSSKRSFAYVHQSLVHIRDIQAIPDLKIYYTVRDLIDGVTLQNVLSEGRRFEPIQVLEILRQTLEALTPVHRANTCHGGIKPSNLFLCDRERVRVILGDPSHSMVPIHNPERLSYDYRYAPPELFRGGEVPGPRADFYALGCLAYELLCGDPPFVSDNPFELVTKHSQEPIPPPSRKGGTLGPAGDALVTRLLAKSPTDRFADLEQALRALEELQTALQPRRTEDTRRPVTLLGQESLARYDAPSSVLNLGRATAIPGELESPIQPPSEETPPSETGDKPRSQSCSLCSAPVTPDQSHCPDCGAELDSYGAIYPPSKPFDRPQLTQKPAPPRPKPAPESPPPGRPALLTASGSSSPGSATVVGQLEPGQVVFDKYLVLRLLGQGGMGTVWLVKHLELDVERALKMIVSGVAADAEFRARFKLEARVMALFSHPNAVSVHDARMSHDAAFIEMEFVRGRSISTMLEPGVPMPLDWTARILVQLCDVLQVAHDHGIVHRDLKPSNLMLVDGRPPGQEPLKVLDFGIAKLLGTRDLDKDFHTLGNKFIGTPAYTSPEQATGKADARSDVYSVGVILYEFLTGHRPFTGTLAQQISDAIHTPPPPFRMVNPNVRVPNGIEKLVMRCLAKSPDQRPQTAHELSNELARFLTDAETGAADAIPPSVSL